MILFLLSVLVCQKKKDSEEKSVAPEILGGFDLDSVAVVNDDNSVDCDENDCNSEAVCSQSIEICDDGQDNDNDTFVDCVDADCSADPVCSSLPTEEPTTEIVQTKGKTTYRHTVQEKC